MGVLKFRLNSPDAASRFPELRRAYITGLDRTPNRVTVELRPGMLLCHRETNESGRLFVPWPVPGQGTPIVGTATLAERGEPYDLAVELARGKLNDVRNQLADWRQMGLRTPSELDTVLAKAHRAFIRAATLADSSEGAYAAAQESLAACWQTADLLTDAYTDQVLRTRLTTAHKLPTMLGCALEGDPKHAAWATELAQTANSALLPCSWKSVAPAEGQHKFDEFDAQLAWARRQHLQVQAGPLLDFRPHAIPHWMWIWEGDFDTILSLTADHVRHTVARYRGKVPIWHLIHRPACTEVLGLSEEEQIRIAARVIQVARQADPAAQFTIGVERPWAEWMGSSPFQLGPLHLADYLVRADLGIAGIYIEIAPGFSAPGSHIRDLFDFSKLLDLYALLNLPLHIGFAFPSSPDSDALAEPSIRVETAQWPAPPDEAIQLHWSSRWLALAAAKPYVRSVNWLQASDASPHLYPHAGLFRRDNTAKPLVGWLKAFRREYVA
jgi:hypothetical protein